MLSSCRRSGEHVVSVCFTVFGAVALVSSRARGALLLSFVVLGSQIVGCASAVQRLMPTPSVVSLGVIDPIAAVPSERRQPSGTVFIASNRGVADVPDDGEIFTNERSHLLHLAASEVSIGGEAGWEQLVAATVSPSRSGRPVVEVGRAEYFGVLWMSEPPTDFSAGKVAEPDTASTEATARWVAAINAELAVSPGSDILIYVHGFNTEFHANTGIAAEAWHYGGRDGVVLSYAWPSRHRLLGYGADKANAAYAVRHFRLLLGFLAEQTDAVRINIIAHSAGCPIVVDALRDIRLANSELSAAEVQAAYRIGRVVLAAPDMDLMRFFNARLDGFDDLVERVSIYASRVDGALRLSSLLFGDDRLGRSVGHLTEWEQRAVLLFDHIEIVDVSRPEGLLGDFLGHGYYHRDPWVSSDMLLLIDFGLSASERGLVRDIETGFWEFPDNYLEGLGGLVLPE